ncbi:MAG: AMP-binding protein [Bacteroidetes bacterium]|nr:AMP-binding protein [Bacteroidota bacterium]
MTQLLMSLYRLLLSLRYKVKLEGADLLKEDTPGVFFPNHQAMADSQLIVTHLYRYTTIKPVIGEQFYNVPFLKTVFRRIGAVPVADLLRGSKDIDVLDKIVEAVISSLKNGDNVLLYPAGHLTGQGYEKIINKKSAWQICSLIPENARIIVVRVSGLWGSMWSKAWSGRSPGFFRTYLKAVFFVIANFIFFLPRRKVTISFVDITAGAREAARGTMQEFNRYLENFYNSNGEEKAVFLRHYFFAPELKRSLPVKIEGSVAELAETEDISVEDIPAELFEDIAAMLSAVIGCDPKDVRLNSNLNLDLGVDSISLVSIVSSIESKYPDVPQVSITTLKTVAQLCLLAMGKIFTGEELKPSSIHIHKSPVRQVSADVDKTIPQAFIEVFSEYPAEAFSYDRIMGCTTRKEFLLKAYVVSRIIRKHIKDKHVGIMLPAMQSTTLLIMAAYLAGKVPVMFNWTAGKRVMNHCMDIVGIRHILTAGKFFDRIRELLPDEAVGRCIFFEKKVQEAGPGIKLSGLFSYFFRRKPSFQPVDTAVILFTSGSEALPKAVPLSHKNLMSDLKGALKHLQIGTDKILLGFLPPFHSFGFTILSVMPAVTGLKVVYTPDPTDGKEIVRLLRHTRANTVLATPTFLKIIMSSAKSDDLSHIRMAVTGAESLHPTVISEFYSKAGKEAVLLEGYGITECSPVLTINPLTKQKEKSVGTFLEGIEVIIADYATFVPLVQGREGMILVRGENVFGGYPDPDVESPFVEVNRKTYYKTGDLGYLDDEGFLFITGRLKRFIKVAGEMISLQAVENALLEKYGMPDRVTLAVTGSETEDETGLVLHAIMDIDIKEAASVLREKGFSALVKILSVKKIAEVPLLGTGKTDYKQLSELEGRSD